MSSFDCQHCDRTFKTEKGRSQHSRAVHNRYQCQKCDRTFKTENGLERHVNAVHPPVYECQECHRTLKTEEGLEQHINAVHPLYECQECDRAFKTENGLERHVNAVHPPLYECQECHRTLKTEEGLEQHVNAVHATNKKQRRRKSLKISDLKPPIQLVLVIVNVGRVGYQRMHIYENTWVNTESNDESVFFHKKRDRQGHNNWT